jgi:signal transduction histidine kinase
MLMQIEELKGRRRAQANLDHGLAELQNAVREVLTELRRLLYDLRGSTGLQDDFVLTLRNSLLPRMQQRFGVRIELVVGKEWPSNLAPDAALNLYRIIQEAVVNAAHHGGANSIEIELKLDVDGRLVVLVSDNGLGLFEYAEPGLGILGMRERTMLLGGELGIERSQRGTVVRAAVPRMRR